MSEVLARQVEDRPVERLLTHYADGSDAAVADATKLTLEMITETATWFDGKGDPRAPEGAEKVWQAWIGLVRKGIGGEEAEAFDRRWVAAFAKASAAAIAAGKLEAAAKARETIAAERKAELEAAAKEAKSFILRPRQVPAEPKASLLDRPLKSTRAGLALPGVAGEVQDYYLRTAMQPKLAVTTNISNENFAAMLDRAIARGHGMKLIERQAEPEQRADE